MKKLILVIAILLIFVALFRTFYSEQFTDDYYLNTPSPSVPFFGDTEEDDDNALVKEYTNFLGLANQCNIAKTIINKNNKILRDELKIKKGTMQSSYTECKGKYKTQLERFNKFYKAVNNDKEPTERELNAATGGYII
jgi:hypothetical protein